MSTPSGEEPVAQTGRPPVPPPVPADPPADGSSRPPATSAPDETGVLDLRSYPPRVPGRSTRPAGAEDGEDEADRGR